MPKLFVKKLQTVGLALILSSCLQSSRDVPEPEKPGVQDTAASAVFSLPKLALADLASTAQQLVIHVYQSEGTSLGSEVHEPYVFPLDERGQYSMQDLPLGELTFVITLVDASGQVLAEGTLLAVVNPGPQTLPQIELRPKKPLLVPLSFLLALNLVDFPNPPDPAATEPAELRALLKTYKCQNCHSTARPQGGLNVQVYPYQNAEQESLMTILDLIYASITGTGTPDISIMPKGPAVTVKASEAAVVKDFITQIAGAADTGLSRWVKGAELSIDLGASGRFQSQLELKNGSYALAAGPVLVTGQRYTYSLTIFGLNGSKLYELIDGVFDVPPGGKLEIKLDLPFSGAIMTVFVPVDTSGS